MQKKHRFIDSGRLIRYSWPQHIAKYSPYTGILIRQRLPTSDNLEISVNPSYNTTTKNISVCSSVSNYYFLEKHAGLYAIRKTIYMSQQSNLKQPNSIALLFYKKQTCRWNAFTSVRNFRACPQKPMVCFAICGQGGQLVSPKRKA